MTLKQCGMYDEESLLKLSNEELWELYSYFPIRQIIAVVNYKALNKGKTYRFEAKPYDSSLSRTKNILRMSNTYDLKRRVFGPESSFYRLYGPYEWNRYLSTLMKKIK